MTRQTKRNSPGRGQNAVAPAAKGSTILSTLEFLATEKGSEIVERVLSRLSQDDRSRIEGATATEEVPFSLPARLWRAVDAEIGEADPTWSERAGAFSIQLRGVQLYGGLLKKSTPAEFLTQSVSLYNLFYHAGDMEVVEEDQNRAVLRLAGFDSAERDWLFCKRQSGGLERAVSIAGGTNARVRHVRCWLEGDAFCEWDLRWE
jgi:hypothetical protein